MQYAQTSGSSPTTKEIAAVTLPGGSSKAITFDDLQGDPRLQNSFSVTSNGAPGDVLAKLVSRNDSAPGAIELLGKDAQDSNDGGSNPWSIEQGTESTLLFFNHDQAPQIFNVLIASADGSQWNKDFKVAPMETMAISIGDIIQKQMEDDKGKTLPKTAVSGQISWWTVETASGPGTGRLLQSNRASGEARSFACGCPYRLCGDTFTSDYSLILEGFLGVPLDGLGSIICMYQTGSNCGTKQTMQTSSQALSYSWSSSNSAILQINGYTTNSSVNVYGASVGTATMTGTVTATYFGPPGTCTFQGGGPTNVGTMSCSTVTRGSSTTCSVTNAPSGSTFNGWNFKDSSGNTVSGTGAASSWSGKMVTSGTVSVNVVTNGNSSPVSTSVTVTARTSFAFTAVSPTSEPNNSTPSASCGLLSVPSPPTLNSILGVSCLDQEFSINDQTISDSGPNQGYHYVTSVSNSSSGVPTGYYYVISPDLTNTSSAFYQAQTGTYNAQSNPNGYISGANLLADTTRHESGTVNSHYENYVVAQNAPANNLGVVAEAQIGLPSQSTATFESNVKTAITSAANSIKSAWSVQPCNSSYTGYDATCTFQGYVNYNF